MIPEKFQGHVLIFSAWLLPLTFFPWFADSFWTPKWVALYLVTLLLLASARTISFPAFWRFHPVPLALVLFSFLLCAQVPHLGIFLDWFCFLVLVVAAFNQGPGFERRLVLGLSTSALAVMAFGSFGYQNMTAECLGLCVVAQAHALPGLRGARRWLLAGLLALSVGYLVVLSSLAAFLGLLAASLGKRRFALAAIVVVLVAGVGISMSKVKLKNTEIRWIRWQNTACLIAKNPRGLGAGNFEFGYVPYRDCVQRDPEMTEGNLARSPHNGYLELAAEMGVVALPALVAWLFFFLIGIRGFCRSALCFILADAAVAFPMENAYPFFITALVIGLGLKSLVHALPLGSRAGAAAGFVFVLFAGGTISLSRHWQTRDDGLACRLFPANWEACLGKAEKELRRHDLPAARATLESILARSPHHFPALRSLGFVLLEQGRIDAACGYLSRYDRIFDGQSSLHTDVKALCP